VAGGKGETWRRKTSSSSKKFPFGLRAPTPPPTIGRFGRRARCESREYEAERVQRTPHAPGKPLETAGRVPPPKAECGGGRAFAPYDDGENDDDDDVSGVRPAGKTGDRPRTIHNSALSARLAGRTRSAADTDSIWRPDNCGGGGEKLGSIVDSEGRKVQPHRHSHRHRHRHRHRRCR